MLVVVAAWLGLTSLSGYSPFIVGGASQRHLATLGHRTSGSASNRYQAEVGRSLAEAVRQGRPTRSRIVHSSLAARSLLSLSRRYGRPTPHR